MNDLYSYSNIGSGVNSSVGSNINYGNPYYSPSGRNVVGNINSQDRFIGGGFVFPFLLGGVTGAAIAPAFWRPPYNRPYYGPYYGPGPFYGPYRPF